MAGKEERREWVFVCVGGRGDLRSSRGLRRQDTGRVGRPSQSARPRTACPGCADRMARRTLGRRAWIGRR